MKHNCGGKWHVNVKEDRHDYTLAVVSDCCKAIVSWGTTPKNAKTNAYKWTEGKSHIVDTGSLKNSSIRMLPLLIAPAH